VSEAREASPFNEAQSPSAALAGVTLNSDAHSDMGNDGREPPSHASLQDSSVSHLNSSVPDENTSPLRPNQSRSSSPAKRSASEMEQSNAAHDTMDIDDTKPLLQRDSSLPDESSNTSSAPYLASSSHGSSGTALPSSTPTEVDSDDVVISPDDQIQLVTEEIQQLKSNETEGFAGYLVAMSWLQRVIAHSKFDKEMGPLPKSAYDGDIGPVDNESIIDSSMPPSAARFPPLTNLAQSNITFRDEMGKHFVPLKKGTRIADDFEIVPETSWNLIIKWYGLKPGQLPIIRYQHDVSQGSMIPEMQFELHPPIFTLRKLTPAASKLAGPEQVDPAPRLLSSTSRKYMEFLKMVKTNLNIPLLTKVSVVRVLDSDQPVQPAAPMSPPASRDASPARTQPPVPKLVDRDTFKELESEDRLDKLENKDETMNEKYNGNATLKLLGLATDQTLIIIEESPKKAEPKNKARSQLKDTDSAPSSGRASPAGIMTRGRMRAQGRNRGIVGLTNLGNTCYMNSALQCMRACQELSVFFLSIILSPL